MKVYVAGPMLDCSDSQKNVWREFFKDRVLNHIKVLDPTKRDYSGKEDDCFTQIVEEDKAEIDQCDIVVVYPWKNSAGTSMEILYAFERGIPVFTKVSEHGEVVSPWIRYHSTKLFTDWGELINEVNTFKKE